MARSTRTSPYFTRQRPEIASCLPFPPSSATTFGLIQESLAREPFRLLIATIFLNRTRGGAAKPVLDRVFEKYTTIESLAKADIDELAALIHRLGFQYSRAKKCIAIAQTWIANPPKCGKRYRKLHYPNKSDGLDIQHNDVVPNDDDRIAWEIAHLPGIGPYAIDSWRIFCRDELRNLAKDWDGADTPEGFMPEWKSVLPKDKELRAFLMWMWLKDGWIWSPQTGAKIAASKRILRMAQTGGLVLESLNGRWFLNPTATGESSVSIDVETAKFVVNPGRSEY